MDAFLLIATIYLTAAVIAVPLAARLGLGSVLGYLLAGIAIGPVLGLVGTEMQDLQHFAEFGVVMMLFLIGLEMDPRTLWDMRDRLLGLGGAQIVCSAVVIMAGAMWVGLPWQSALAVGLILTLSSTAIVLQTLTERNQMRTAGGRAGFAVLLGQDLAVIPMLALLPLLAVTQPPSIAADGSILRGGVAATHPDGALSLVAELPGWGVTLATLGAVATVIIAGRYLSRPLFNIIHRTRLHEMFTVVALLIVVGIAALMSLVGLSPALGTFLAGVVLANSEFRHELESSIEPFKGLLLGLFFMTVGAGINLNLLGANFLEIIGLTLALMIAKGAILYGLATVFRLRGANKWLFTLALAQAGEFGFLLVGFTVQTNVIADSLGQILLLVIAMTMVASPLFFLLQSVLARRFAEGADQRPEDDEIDEQHGIIVVGIGRFGQVVIRMLNMSGFATTMLDTDLATVQLMRRFGFKSFYGDPTRPELLHAAGLASASVLIAALDDKDATTKLVKYARHTRPDLRIIARARDRMHVYELYRAGADHIVREMFDSSLRAARYALEELGLSEFEANEVETAFYKHDRKTLRELANLWQPGVPVEQNEAYVERARQMQKELETALVTKAETTPVLPANDNDME